MPSPCQIAKYARDVCPRWSITMVYCKGHACQPRVVWRWFARVGRLRSNWNRHGYEFPKINLNRVLGRFWSNFGSKNEFSMQNCTRGIWLDQFFIDFENSIFGNLVFRNFFKFANTQNTSIIIIYLIHGGPLRKP